MPLKIEGSVLERKKEENILDEITKPKWFHPHAHLMTSKTDRICHENKTTSVEVIRLPSGQFEVRYYMEIVENNTSVEGNFHISKKQFKVAYGLHKEPQAKATLPGKFKREGNYLGIIHDEDDNEFIIGVPPLTEEVKAMARHMI